MTTPSEKLATSLEALKFLQDQGKVAIKGNELTRTHRERLLHSGFLQEVIKGWYIPTNPDKSLGESTAFYASFWPFSAAYLHERFKDQWCLSPEQSLLLQVGNWTVPKQLLIRSPVGDNKITALPEGTSLLNIRTALPDPGLIETKQALRVFSIPAALVSCSKSFFQHNPIEARAALSMIHEPSDVLRLLLEGGHSVIASRLVGAFREIGCPHVADNIQQTMQAASYTIRENNPFVATSKPLTYTRERSPYVKRLQILWHVMRDDIMQHFPMAPGIPHAQDAYLKQVDETYINDAYHSLSIEGYRVSPELIQRVREQQWDPEHTVHDNNERNALAARGYWQAFQQVKHSVKQVLDGHNPGEVARLNHSAWYRELFGPSVVAGLLRPADLAGYRNGPVFIKQSMHVPPSCEAVRDLMPAFYDLLAQETEPSVRVVLGHFIFVNIHPYFDGNGRIGRFLMNVMLASGGYPWTVIPVTQRETYMASLEQASTAQNIIPFTQFLASLVGDQ